MGTPRRALPLSAIMTLVPVAIAAAQPARGADEAPHAAEEAPENDGRAAAPEGDERVRLGDEAIATRTLNQLANLFQIPIAHNFEWGLGATEGGFRYLLTTRPRIPIPIADDWLLVTTAFFRFHVLDDVLAPDGSGGGSFVGTGDSDVYSLIAPPSVIEGLLFGLGPFAILPSSDPRLGSLHVGFGPGGAVTWQSHGVVLNLIVLHAFSFVDDPTDYSQTQLLPTLSYVFDTGLSIVVQSETVYEWHSDTWVVPLSAGVAQIISPGPLLRMSVGIQGKWWPVSPLAGPDWGARVFTTLLFPELDTPA